MMPLKRRKMIMLLHNFRSGRYLLNSGPTRSIMNLITGNLACTIALRVLIPMTLKDSKLKWQEHYNSQESDGIAFANVLSSSQKNIGKQCIVTVLMKMPTRSRRSGTVWLWMPFTLFNLQCVGGGVNTLGPELRKVFKDPVLEVYWDSLDTDLLLVENQIPMELLMRVVGILVTEYKHHMGEMQEWESEDWRLRNIGHCVPYWSFLFDPQTNDDTSLSESLKRRIDDWLRNAEFYRGVHTLDSTYRMLCEWESFQTPQVKYFPPGYSATHLEACGVTIKGKEFTCSEDISFEKGCLSVPFLRVYDDTERYLRNLVMYETLVRLDGRWQHATGCYALFMEGLMRTPEDFALLEKLGVITVGVGSHGNVMDMWKRINYHVSEPRITDNFFAMMTDVSNYTKQRRNKHQFEFTKKFCSRTWIQLSYLAATIVTLATLIQTYVAVIGSNGMKPHFAPQH